MTETGKILLVDDEQLIQRHILGMLSRDMDQDGNSLYEILFACDGKSALDVIKQEQPDVIVLDRIMPGLSGDEVCVSIKTDDTLRTTRVIMISAKSASDDRVAGLTKGADDYVCKPFSIKELCARIRVHLAQKKAEDKLRFALNAAQHDQTLGRLTPGVVHDFNNILQNMEIHEIMSYYLQDLEEHLQYLKDEPDNSEDQESRLNASLDLAQQTQHFCHQLRDVRLLGESITQGLLTYSRQENDHCVALSLTGLIKSLLNIFQRQFKQSQIKVVCDIQAELPSILCRPSGLQQILLNLISNAIDAMRVSEKKQLTIKAWQEEEWICFFVKDTGSGIPEEEHGKIFDHLFTTKHDRGTGIGLTVVQRVVKEHLGDLQVESAPQQGTTFTVRLPLMTEIEPETLG